MTDIDPSSASEPTAPVPGPDLTALARQALLEVTPESTVGASAGTVDEGDGVVSVLFANRMPGYPGWRWTVSIAQVEGDEPSVLEVELMPGDGSLVAPEWVPWSDRLAEYRAGQDAEHAHDDDEDATDADDYAQKVQDAVEVGVRLQPNTFLFSWPRILVHPEKVTGIRHWLDVQRWEDVKVDG